MAIAILINKSKLRTRRISGFEPHQRPFPSMRDTNSPLLAHFLFCKVLLDQLPAIGYYVLTIVNGSLNLPIKAVETKEEALSLSEDAQKIVLTGKYQYRLWRLGVKDMPIMLLAEHSSLDALKKDASTRNIKTYMSGPGVP